MLNYMRIAYQLATLSPDTSNQVGAVIVNDDEIIGTGYNNFPGGIEGILEPREVKYKRILHAEVDAILSVMCWRGVSDAILYCNWGCCCGCASAIIGTRKIKTLVVHGPRMDTTPARWKADIDYSLSMIEEAGIKIITLECKIPDAPEIIVNGEAWQP